MTLAVLLVSALCLTGLASCLEHLRQTRRINAMQERLDELSFVMRETQLYLAGLADQQRRLWLRMDRLQKLVEDRGWRDSHLLTVFDWRKPQ